MPGKTLHNCAIQLNPCIHTDSSSLLPISHHQNTLPVPGCLLAAAVALHSQVLSRDSFTACAAPSRLHCTMATFQQEMQEIREAFFWWQQAQMFAALFPSERPVSTSTKPSVLL
jgi:hypothetical protein